MLYIFTRGLNSMLLQVQDVKELWDTQLDLERRSKDPSRLGNYKKLAQEEKDRKRVNIRLPKMEEKLVSSPHKTFFSLVPR